MAVDPEVMGALEQGGAVLNGHFQLNSGRHSDRYLEKFNLLQWPQHTELVCRKMADAGRAYAPRTVAGPTTGGVILAYEVGRQLGLRGIFCERDPGGGRSFQRDFHLAPGEPVMVVDDVMTSGESVFDTIEAVKKAGGRVTSVAVMVDRSGGRVDFGDVPFFAATEVEMQTWTPEDCPLCKQGVPLKVT
ncbi:MAG: orotate phosphoribosyltransferase [Dehalococcoidia bacterium]|nr:orotate phosphoribosyltransferase [Dehalococcoidia bacterium]